MEADEGFYEEFLAFRARQQDQHRSNLSEAAPASEPDHHTHSPTFGRSSDPVPPRDNYQRGRSMQRHAPTSSRGPGRVSNGTSCSNSASPPWHPKTVSVHTRGQSMAPPLPRSTPPPLPRSDNYRSSSHTPRDPSPHRRDYSAPRNPPATSHRGNSAAPRSSSLAPRHDYTPTEHGSSPTSRRGRSPTPCRSPAPPHEHLPRRSPARRERSPCRERSPAPHRSRLPPRRRDKTPDKATGSDNEPANPDTIK
ncbi:hypothetical protein FS749_010550 [Ceratobasidium sp. UAMH 11750]|nr:hypothetical protein FS749_010550 [Ceratobasidium sp. UAMH 11750]